MGYPTLLGNSVTEGGFVRNSSCMGCHARAAIGPDGPAPLGVFIEQLAEDGYPQSAAGAPNPNWYYSSSSTPELIALPFDFVWGVLFAQPLTTTVPSAAAPPTQIANPASENCVQQGGTVTLETRDDGGQYGVCVFEDNRQCEEWTLLRGDCPVGGIKVTGYVTDAARYCAITGGTYAVDEAATDSANEEQGSCTLPDGTTCDVYDYYNGTCSEASGGDEGATAPSEGAGQGADADPFAYCAQVGTDDSPPNELVDGQLPDSVIQAMIAQEIISADMPAEMQQNATWRCMDGQVWACTYGANLPCDEKADLSETPSDAMTTYCQENADSDVIPAAVTGRATVYSWRCDGETPTIVKQVGMTDAQGYLANFWYELTPPQ